MSNVYLSLSPAPIIEMIDKLAKNWDKMCGEVSVASLSYFAQVSNL